MDNKHPKSEMPALKEAAAAAKDKQGLDKSILKEKKHHEKTTSDAMSMATFLDGDTVSSGQVS